jgi:hypothetical protein
MQQEHPVELSGNVQIRFPTSVTLKPGGSRFNTRYRELETNLLKVTSRHASSTALRYPTRPDHAGRDRVYRAVSESLQNHLAFGSS